MRRPAPALHAERVPLPAIYRRPIEPSGHDRDARGHHRHPRRHRHRPLQSGRCANLHSIWPVYGYQRQRYVPANHPLYDEHCQLEHAAGAANSDPTRTGPPSHVLSSVNSQTGGGPPLNGLPTAGHRNCHGCRPIPARTTRQISSFKGRSSGRCRRHRRHHPATLTLRARGEGDTTRRINASRVC